MVVEALVPAALGATGRRVEPNRTTAAPVATPVASVVAGVVASTVGAILLTSRVEDEAEPDSHRVDCSGLETLCRETRPL